MKEVYDFIKECGMYSEDDDNTEVLYFEDAVATFSSVTQAPKQVKF